MFKFIVIFAVIACAAAKPGFLAPLAYSSPLVAAAPGIVTATSSQVIARNYNGIAAAPVAVAAPIAAKVVAAPLAYSAPVVAAPYAKYVSAPLAVAPATYGYAAAPLAAKYVSPLSYAAPATYFI